MLALSRTPGPALPGVTHIPYDQSDEASITAAARTVTGPIDYVIHNVAIRGDTGGLATLTADHLSEVMRINVAGPLLLTRALIPHLSPGATLALSPAVRGLSPKAATPMATMPIACPKPP